MTNSHALCSTRVKRRFNAILSNLLQVYKCVTKKAIYELISQGHCIPVSLQICFTALKKKVLMEVSYTHTHSWSHFEWPNSLFIIKSLFIADMFTFFTSFFLLNNKYTLYHLWECITLFVSIYVVCFEKINKLLKDSRKSCDHSQYCERRKESR